MKGNLNKPKKKLKIIKIEEKGRIGKKERKKERKNERRGKKEKRKEGQK